MTEQNMQAVAQRMVQRYDGYLYDWFISVLRTAVKQERAGSENRWPANFARSWENYQQQNLDGQVPYPRSAVLEVAEAFGFKRNPRAENDFIRNTEQANKVLLALRDFNEARDAASRFVDTHEAVKLEASTALQNTADIITTKLDAIRNRIDSAEIRTQDPQLLNIFSNISDTVSSIQPNVEQLLNQANPSLETWLKVFQDIGISVRTDKVQNKQRVLIRAFTQFILDSILDSREDDIGCRKVFMSCTPPQQQQQQRQQQEKFSFQPATKSASRQQQQEDIPTFF